MFDTTGITDRVWKIGELIEIARNIRTPRQTEILACKPEKTSEGKGVHWAHGSDLYSTDRVKLYHYPKSPATLHSRLPCQHLGFLPRSKTSPTKNTLQRGVRLVSALVCHVGFSRESSWVFDSFVRTIGRPPQRFSEATADSLSRLVDSNSSMNILSSFCKTTLGAGVTRALSLGTRLGTTLEYSRPNDFLVYPVNT